MPNNARQRTLLGATKELAAENVGVNRPNPNHWENHRALRRKIQRWCLITTIPGSEGASTVLVTFYNGALWSKRHL